jgi:hypothetical protein
MLCVKTVNVVGLKVPNSRFVHLSVGLAHYNSSLVKDFGSLLLQYMNSFKRDCYFQLLLQTFFSLTFFIKFVSSEVSFFFIHRKSTKRSTTST